MTPEVCANAQVGEVARLMDVRDNKQYWIGKFKDNNCWMTQNLALDLSAGRTLTPNDTDITENWTPPANTVTNLSDWNAADVTDAISYNPGLYVYTTPSVNHSCVVGKNNRPSSLEQCANSVYMWRNVSGMEAAQVSNFGPDVVDGVYNAHYLSGNYYTWSAATAESGNQFSTYPAEAESSVCPKGWKLPTGGNDLSINQFAALLAKYGWAWEQSSTDTSHSASTTQGYLNALLAPFYLVVSGAVYNSTTIQGVGAAADLSTSTVYGSGNFYHMTVSTYTIVPDYINGRGIGTSVRCVAK